MNLSPLRYRDRRSLFIAQAVSGLVTMVTYVLSSVRTSVVSGGALCIAGVIVCGLLLPRFVGCDARARQ